MRALFAKKRLEIIVEGALVERVLDVLEKQGAEGYTILPASAGRGDAGRWRRDDITPALGRTAILVVASDAMARKLAEAVYDLLADHAAMILLSDVEVFRDADY
jgi:nitrogen regulatory protein PII